MEACGCSTRQSGADHGVFRLPFDDPSSDTQNLKEFLGYILFLLLVHFCVPRGQLRLMAWVGDNTSALSWAESHKVKSTAGQSSNLIEAWLLIYTDMWLTGTTHNPGHLMGVIDDLSRDRPTPSLRGVPAVDLLSVFPTMTSLFELCNPLVVRSLDEHYVAFGRVHEILCCLV